MITVAATVTALFPLALHGGPLWQPLCYAQVAGLSIATFITLLLVSVLYSVFVLDLGIIRWETSSNGVSFEENAGRESSAHRSAETEIGGAL